MPKSMAFFTQPHSKQPMKTWRCVFADGAEFLILAKDKAIAILSAAELYGSNPINVFPEGEW